MIAARAVMAVAYRECMASLVAWSFAHVVSSMVSPMMFFLRSLLWWWYLARISLSKVDIRKVVSQESNVGNSKQTKQNTWVFSRLVHFIPKTHSFRLRSEKAYYCRECMKSIGFSHEYAQWPRHFLEKNRRIRQNCRKNGYTTDTMHE